MEPVGIESMRLVEKVVSKFREHAAVVGVIGLGYAGLPVGFAFAEAGLKVVGFDIDDAKIEALNAGNSYLRHLTATRLRASLESGMFKASSNFDELSICDAALICVPTPLDDSRSPDLSSVVTTTQRIAQHLHRGQLVVLESTTYPGTTSEVLLPILESSGLKVGEEFFLAFSPEREDPGNNQFSITNIPKLVGGITSSCLTVACAVYQEIVARVVPVSSARIAEASKLLENTFRCINVAMVNELKVVFANMGINIWEVIEAASTKPFGFVPFSPGPGLGGHCIPIDPFYLSWKSRQFGIAPRLVELAGEINSAMPKYVVDRVIEGLGKGGKTIRNSNILLVGVAYKREIDDVRESPALTIINLLRSEQAEVKYHDPYVPILHSRHLPTPMLSVEFTPANIASADAAVIVTDHREIDYSLLMQNAALVIDTRNATATYRNSKCPVINA
jgi:UDP-N-acetyl-D-glucosamine dehydrogenase